MITIDKSLGKPWRDQRDDTWKPHSACNVQSYRMAADQAEIKCPGDENLFMAHMNKPHWYQQIVARFPWAWEEVQDPASPSYNKINYIFPPEQIHDLLAEGFVDWTEGLGSADFGTCRTRREIMLEILHGNGVVLSGKFPYRGGRSIRHIVSLAGFNTLQSDVLQCVAGQVDPDRIVSWIIDDPYGDYRTEYESHDGNGVRMSPEDFTRHIKGPGRDCNWAHFLGVA